MSQVDPILTNVSPRDLQMVRNTQSLTAPRWGDEEFSSVKGLERPRVTFVLEAGWRGSAFTDLRISVGPLGSFTVRTVPGF